MCKIKKVENELHIGKWYVGWHSWMFELCYAAYGYETPYAQLHISIFGWHSLIKLPWRTHHDYWDVDVPEYGIKIYDSTLWVMGGKNKHWTWHIPFFSKKFVAHRVDISNDDEPVLIDITGRHSVIHNYGPDRPASVIPHKNQYLYKDSYDGTIVPCEYWIEEREWRPKWLTWTKLFRTVRRYIEVSFSDEVGRDKGSWKGGCMGCSYDLLPGETAKQCIERMEKERKF